jgi:hypothetical protein
MRRLLWILIIGAGMAATVALGQQWLTPGSREAALTSMPVFAADGHKIGSVVQIGIYQGQKALIASVDPRIGVRPQDILIPKDLYRERGNRIELTLTTPDVKRKLAKN